MLLDEIDAIARDKENIYHNIAQARQAIKEIFYFTYCDSPLDLPTAALDAAAFGDIPYNNRPRADILSMEAGALVRIFVFEQNPLLDRPRRLKVLRDILTCCTQAERAFLLHVIRHRSIPGISRQDIAAVYGDDFFKPRPRQPRPAMQKVAARAVDDRQEYVAFKELRSLGYVQ
jgi:hypothetical protein